MSCGTTYEGEEENEDDDDMLGLYKIARARDRHGPPSVPKASQPPGSGAEKKVRARVRRPRRPDETGETASRDKRRSRRSKTSQDLSKPGDKIGAGDSRVIYDLDLPPDAFEQIHGEVAWQKMYHMSGQVPRLVAVPHPIGNPPATRTIERNHDHGRRRGRAITAAHDFDELLAR